MCNCMCNAGAPSPPADLTPLSVSQRPLRCPPPLLARPALQIRWAHVGECVYRRPSDADIASCVVEQSAHDTPSPEAWRTEPPCPRNRTFGILGRPCRAMSTTDSSFGLQVRQESDKVAWARRHVSSCRGRSCHAKLTHGISDERGSLYSVLAPPCTS